MELRVLAVIGEAAGLTARRSTEEAQHGTNEQRSEQPRTSVAI
jgi:hypothetical protein